MNIIVKKVRHQFIETQCPQCGHIEKMKIPKQLLSNNQYGTGIQALALTLMNEGYVSINRTAFIIKGLTQGQITPSEGYISKLNKRLYQCLETFENEMKKEIVKLKITHWDDEITFTNDTVERGLRTSKTKMKVLGQFNNIKSAQYFAGIKSYIETGHRYGIGSYRLIKAALEGRAYTIEEMKKHNEFD